MVTATPNPTDHFYGRLSCINRLVDITDISHYVTVPPDWQVLITDIRGSTRAIEQGRYKEVNLIAACSIVALLNLAKPLGIEIPFVFGGDGASMVVPPALFESAKQALLSTQQMAGSEFGFDLRVGHVPVQTLIEAGYPLKVAKLQVSANFNQAIFVGGGLRVAEQLIKDPQTCAHYLLKASSDPLPADYSGLECRWQDVPSPEGEIVSLLVVASPSTPEQEFLVYRQVILAIEQLYGSSLQRRPVHPSGLNLTLSGRRLNLEAKVQTYGQGWRRRWVYRQWIRLVNLLGMVLIGWRIRQPQMDWSQYKNIVIGATDYEKFDDVLRMVITGTPAQRQQLTDYLETIHQNGSVVYGYHVSDRALMTCLVFERNGSQVHFIDGADGGYALAAKTLKARLQKKLPLSNPEKGN